MHNGKNLLVIQDIEYQEQEFPALLKSWRLYTDKVKVEILEKIADIADACILRNFISIGLADKEFSVFVQAALLVCHEKTNGFSNEEHFHFIQKIMSDRKFDCIEYPDPQEKYKLTHFEKNECNAAARTGAISATLKGFENGKFSAQQLRDVARKGIGVGNHKDVVNYAHGILCYAQKLIGAFPPGPLVLTPM